MPESSVLREDIGKIKEYQKILADANEMSFGQDLDRESAHFMAMELVDLLDLDLPDERKADLVERIVSHDPEVEVASQTIQDAWTWAWDDIYAVDKDDIEVAFENALGKVDNDNTIEKIYYRFNEYLNRGEAHGKMRWLKKYRIKQITLLERDFVKVVLNSLNLEYKNLDEISVVLDPAGDLDSLIDHLPDEGQVGIFDYFRDLLSDISHYLLKSLKDRDFRGDPDFYKWIKSAVKENEVALRKELARES